MELRRELVSGEAILRFTATKKGKILALEIVKSSQKEFGEAAMTAVKRWVFAPGIDVDGKTAIPVKMEFSFVFEFHDSIPVE